MGKTLAFRRTLYYNVKYGVQKSLHNIHDTKHDITLYEMLRGIAVDVIKEICPANHVYVSRDVSPGHIPVRLSVLPHLSISRAVQHTKAKCYGEKFTD